MVIQGPSGSGKTTLFRVLAGLWPFGRGRVNVPRGREVLFLPQKPYLPIGTLREALCYPDKPEAHDDASRRRDDGGRARAFRRAARRDRQLVHGHVARRAAALSFARALLVRPDWLFLDEASSALDEATEGACTGCSRSGCPRSP